MASELRVEKISPLDGASIANSVHINNNGNIGIGTDNPLSKLEVKGSARVTGILTVGTSSLTFDGTNNSITVGSGITVNGNTGIITATGGINAKLLGTSELEAISSEISDTAVDVFVYDTRKDSDGGAWRKRTQHTSWYNETLGTSTRGTRREFPSVAVLVLEAGQFTIYDGDDPDLPMWMVFNATAGNILWSAWASLSTGCHAANAIVGLTNSNSGGFITVNFASDTAGLYRSGANGFQLYRAGIVERNDVANYGSSDTNKAIVSSATNDVAMTVLPNAPIDSATGLPVPTIAVATTAGVSVIKDDGTVVDAVGTGFDEVNSISFDKNNRIICSSGTDGTDQAMFSTFAIPSSDLSNDFPGGDNAYYRHTYANTDLSTFPSNGSASNHSINEVSRYGDDICFGTEDDGSTLNPGLKIISENVTSPANGMLCGVSTSYNTGWMHGDIKGAFLSDTDATNAVASTNLASGMNFYATARLTSHTYTNGATSWQMVDNSGDDNGYVQIYLNGTTSGKQYLISLDIDSNPALDSGYDFNVYSFSTTSQIATFSHWDGAGAGTLTAIYTSTHQADDSPTQSDVLTLYVNATTANITNFTVREATEADRSVNNNSLAVYGTITKNVVATGADLVGYSGFSTSNYLEQPYNSDLQVGTGDVYFTWWTKTSVGLQRVWFDYSNANDWNTPSSSNDRLYGIVTVDGELQFTVGSTTYTSPTSSYSADGIWHHIVMQRQSGTVQFYKDGQLLSSHSNANDSVGADNQILVLGTGIHYPDAPWTGDMALFRVGASAPSAEQIKKMYEDEKVLFQENAACTLYGSSDAVTALAYDDSTNLLYAGTSSGRSDFQGLRRINNTTVGITSAISASNGLVAEQ